MSPTTKPPARKRALNAWAKTVPIEHPYMITRSGDWEWRVIKAYKSRVSELTDPYARWLVAVKSPLTYGSYDIGDEYVANVPLDAEARLRIAERLAKEASG